MSKVYQYFNKLGKRVFIKYIPKIKIKDLIYKVNYSRNFENFKNNFPQYRISKKMFKIIKKSIEFGRLLNESEDSDTSECFASDESENAFEETE